MFFPSKKQYSKRSVPSKWSFIGGILTVVGFLLTFYFGCWHKGNKDLDFDDVEKLAEIVISRVLEGSPLCCDIKTADVVFGLPEEGKILVDAASFIGYVPDSLDFDSISFSFSTNVKDSLKLFDCKMVGRRDISIYYFINNRLFCSKPAVFDLRDPIDFCGALSVRKGGKNN